MKKPTAAPELVAEVDAQPVENIDAFHVAIDRWLEIEITTTKPLTVTVASVKGDVDYVLDAPSGQTVSLGLSRDAYHREGFGALVTLSSPATVTVRRNI